MSTELPKEGVTAASGDPYGALRIPAFLVYQAARFTVTVAIQMQGVAVGWQVYELTKDPFSLGVVGLSEAIPAIGVALYAGHVADTRVRKRIIFVTLFALTLCSASLFSLGFLTAEALSAHGVMAIYGIIFLSGIARGFLTPAVFGLFAEIVPRKWYSNAAAWGSSIWQTASISGPAIGGLCLGFFGLKVVYCLDTMLMSVSLVLVCFIRPTIRAVQMEGGPVLESIREGLRFVFSHPIIISAISLDLFAVLFGGAVALLPIFAADILHVGAEGLGLLRAAPSIGAVAMAFWMAHYPPERNSGRWLLLSVGGFGIAMISFALSTDFILSLLLLIVSGACDEVSVVIRSTLLQLSTPDSMRGRVSSVNTIFIGSSNEIGAFESGVAAKLLGVVPSVIVGGMMTLVVVGMMAWKAPALRKLSLLNLRQSA